MHHKLQPSSSKNNGQNSVALNQASSSTVENASNDAGTERLAGTADVRLEVPSTENPQVRTSEPEDSSNGHQTSGRGRPDPRQCGEPLRCEVARSIGYDPTGEHAFPCGAAAQVICEYCGPMCSSCAEETFCFQGEHRFVQDEQPSRATTRDSGAADEASKPLFEVVYLELQCTYCDTVRLALPLAYRPDADWKLVCPICSTPATWRYLAHGLTQRELPFYERFDSDALFRGRIPWDQLLALLEEED